MTEPDINEELFTVFLCGSLKRGEPNHGWFVKNTIGQYQQFMCDAGTVQKYPLVIASKYNMPFLLYEPGVGNNVIGEVFQVDRTVLSKMDAFEDHPRLQTRQEEMVRNLTDTKSTIKVWVYFLRNYKPKLLQNRQFVNYTSKGDHKQPFVIPKYDVKNIVLREVKLQKNDRPLLFVEPLRPKTSSDSPRYFQERQIQVQRPMVHAANQTEFYSEPMTKICTNTEMNTGKKCTCKNMKFENL